MNMVIGHSILVVSLARYMYTIYTHDINSIPFVHNIIWAYYDNEKKLKSTKKDEEQKKNCILAKENYYTNHKSKETVRPSIQSTVFHCGFLYWTRKLSKHSLPQSPRTKPNTHIHSQSMKLIRDFSSIFPRKNYYFFPFWIITDNFFPVKFKFLINGLQSPILRSNVIHLLANRIVSFLCIRFCWAVSVLWAFSFVVLIVYRPNRIPNRSKLRARFVFSKGPFKITFTK